MRVVHALYMNPTIVGTIVRSVLYKGVFNSGVDKQHGLYEPNTVSFTACPFQSAHIERFHCMRILESVLMV